MTSRIYPDACGTAHALELIGERWSLLVVRELVLGPKRYTDLQADLPGISTNVLSSRLGELEQSGVIQRRRLAPPAASWIYELTEWGSELEPIIRALGRWGARSPAHRRDDHLSVTSLVLSLRTNFDPRSAGGLTAEYELRFGENRFRAEVADGAFKLSQGPAAQPVAVFEAADPVALAAVILGGRDIDEARRVGDVTTEGDNTSIERFINLFSLPEPAVKPARAV